MCNCWQYVYKHGSECGRGGYLRVGMGNFLAELSVKQNNRSKFSHVCPETFQVRTEAVSQLQGRLYFHRCVSAFIYIYIYIYMYVCMYVYHNLSSCRKLETDGLPFLILFCCFACTRKQRQMIGMPCCLAEEWNIQ
jgi:hypothetical protein